MPKANSYRAERLLGPHGFSLTDVYIVEGNNRKPVMFRAAGDVIDLSKVGVKAMVRSALSGQISKLLVSGVLSTQLQEVSQDVYNEIQESLAGFGLGNYNENPIKAPVKYVQLEPGVMVAVSQVPDQRPDVEIIRPEAEAEALTVQLEPGLVAPTGAAGRQNPEALDAPEPEAAKTKAKKAKKAAEVPAVAGSPHADWKFNLDFQAQKRTILESADTEFLKWVVANEDSVQFKKLAQTRLAANGL